MKKLLLLFLIIPIVSFGQNEGVQLCISYKGQSLTYNSEANKILE